jgi:hypothetical protein
MTSQTPWVFAATVRTDPPDRRSVYPSWNIAVSDGSTKTTDQPSSTMGSSASTFSLARSWAAPSRPVENAARPLGGDPNSLGEQVAADRRPERVRPAAGALDLLGGLVCGAVPELFAGVRAAAPVARRPAIVGAVAVDDVARVHEPLRVGGHPIGEETVGRRGDGGVEVVVKLRIGLEHQRRCGPVGNRLDRVDV